MIFAFEGIDGSGKATALELVSQELRAQGIEHLKLSFPRYDDTLSGSLIGKYLNSASLQLSPYFVASAFAMDRHESRNLLIADVPVVLCDRYIASNIAFQAARFSSEREIDEYIAWIIDLEVGRLEAPIPTMNIYFDIELEVAEELIKRKSKRSYTDQEFDKFERDREFQRNVKAVYEKLINENTWSHWRKISVSADRKLRPPKEIAAEITNLIIEQISYA